MEGGDGDTQVAQPPTDLGGKSLRCCVPCRLIKTFEQFYEQASVASGCAGSGSCAGSILARLCALPPLPPPLPSCRRRSNSLLLQGCENCPYLDMENDRERVFDCTTSEFKARARLGGSEWQPSGAAGCRDASCIPACASP